MKRQPLTRDQKIGITSIIVTIILGLFVYFVKPEKALEMVNTTFHTMKAAWSRWFGSTVHLAVGFQVWQAFIFIGFIALVTYGFLLFRSKRKPTSTNESSSVKANLLGNHPPYYDCLGGRWLFEAKPSVVPYHDGFVVREPPTCPMCRRDMDRFDFEPNEIGPYEGWACSYHPDQVIKWTSPIHHRHLVEEVTLQYNAYARREGFDEAENPLI